MSRRLTFSFLALTAPNLFVACGDNLEPDAQDDLTIVTPNEEAPAPVPREMSGGMSLGFYACDAAAVDYEALVTYVDDGSTPTDISCRVEFDDGAISNDCIGQHVFAEGGAHHVKMTVHDNLGGLDLVLERDAFVPSPIGLAVTAQAPACGLELSFAAQFAGMPRVVTEISPDVNVVGGGLVQGGSGTVQVTQPGTYTVTVRAEDERPSGPICEEQVSVNVEVVACDNHPEEPHHPGCGH